VGRFADVEVSRFEFFEDVSRFELEPARDVRCGPAALPVEFFEDVVVLPVPFDDPPLW